LELVYQDLGEYDRARASWLSYRDREAALGRHAALGNALNNLGSLETRVGDPDRAIQWLNEARRYYRAIDNAVGLENSVGQLGFAYSQRGELSKSLALLRQRAGDCPRSRHALGERPMICN
jgi:tetratricopeptide (TPR) repeat protein